MEEKRTEVDGKVYRFMPLCACGEEMTLYYNDKNDEMVQGGYCVPCEKFQPFPKGTKHYPRYLVNNPMKEPEQNEKKIEVNLKTYQVVPICDCGEEMMPYNKYTGGETSSGLICLKCKKQEKLSWNSPRYPRYETVEVG